MNTNDEGYCENYWDALEESYVFYREESGKICSETMKARFEGDWNRYMKLMESAVVIEREYLYVCKELDKARKEGWGKEG